MKLLARILLVHLIIGLNSLRCILLRHSAHALLDQGTQFSYTLRINFFVLDWVLLADCITPNCSSLFWWRL